MTIFIGTLKLWARREHRYIGMIYGDTRGRYEDGEEIYTGKVLEGPTPDGIITTQFGAFKLEPYP